MWKALLFRFINFWPPYLGAGIRVRKISSDYSSFDVELRMRFWNRNYVGTHFGGSLYALADPFFMLILLKNLGPQYIVWDKAATIHFKKPGRGTVRAHFHIPAAVIDSIRAEADGKGKAEPRFSAAIFNQSGEIVAVVEKLLYVRRKDSPRS